VTHTLENALQGLAIEFFVVDDENVRIPQGGSSGGKSEGGDRSL
jgi:hypothetical protein